MYGVILAGGGGTRLWPLSRPDRPKPFLPLLGDQTLLQLSARRLAPLISPEDVYVVTDRRYLPIVFEQLPEVPRGNVLGEPMGRNTAAAVALAAEAIDRPEAEVMLILPADQRVHDEAAFRDSLRIAGVVAETGSLVTLGVTPAGPETGYGYVLASPPPYEVDGHATYRVERFVEKPSVDRAAAMIETGLASWNAGIFAWTRGTIRERLRRHAPDIVDPIAEAVPTDGSQPDLDSVYPGVRATSIDYAVMEPASVDGAVSVVPMDAGWSDLGSWSALRDAWSEDTGSSGAMGTGNRRDVGSSRTLVLAGEGRLVVTIGVRDIIVVDTPDAVLICDAGHAQDVRGVAEEFERATRDRAKEKA